MKNQQEKSTFKFSLILLSMAMLLGMNGLSTLKAQDEMPSEEEELEIPLPQGSAGNGQTQPIILDESDSSAVQEVEEYDGL